MCGGFFSGLVTLIYTIAPTTCFLFKNYTGVCVFKYAWVVGLYIEASSQLTMELIDMVLCIWAKIVIQFK